MGLWQRLKRLFRASTGAALEKLEDPEMVLQQTIRDMRDRVPELNNSVAQVMATERLLSKNKEPLISDSLVKHSWIWNAPKCSLNTHSSPANKR